MGHLVERAKTIRKKKLLVWAVRQSIGVCLIIPIVVKWPHFIWLLPLWIGFALLSLVVTVVMLRRFEARFADLESRIDEIGRSSVNSRNGTLPPNGFQSHGSGA